MKIYELLDSADKLCKEALARDMDGNPIDWRNYTINPNTYSYCLVGAIVKCYGHGRGFSKVSKKLLLLLKNKYPCQYDMLSSYNNKESTTYEDVIALCREADV